MSTTPSPVERAASAILETQAVVKELLNNSEYGYIYLGVDADLTRLVNRLHHLSGIARPAVASFDHPPITEYSAEGVDAPQLLNLADLDSPKPEVSLLRDKVEKLYGLIETIAPEGILADYTLPEDQLVVRGVAKWAGIPDYEDREFDLEFIEDIQAGIAEKRNNDRKQREIDEQLARQNNIVKLTERLDEVTKKRNVLENDRKEAAETALKAKAGVQQQKAAKVLEGIEDEIKAADELIESINKELEDLQA